MKKKFSKNSVCFYLLLIRVQERSNFSPPILHTLIITYKRLQQVWGHLLKGEVQKIKNEVEKMGTMVGTMKLFSSQDSQGRVLPPVISCIMFNLILITMKRLQKVSGDLVNMVAQKIKNEGEKTDQKTDQNFIFPKQGKLRSFFIKLCRNVV